MYIKKQVDIRNTIDCLLTSRNTDGVGKRKDLHKTFIYSVN